MDPVVGVLALQGAFVAHEQHLDAVGVTTRQVRVASDFDTIDALVIPGGESTTMSMLLDSAGLLEPIETFLADGRPVMGTCAGLILLAATVLDGRSDQRSFGALDISVRRNGYGRQLQSFEAELDLCLPTDGRREVSAGETTAEMTAQMTDGAGFPGVFIRAPRIETCGPDVEVLGTLAGEPVLVRQGPVIGATFHPELTGDHRLHRYFVESAALQVHHG